MNISISNLNSLLLLLSIAAEFWVDKFLDRYPEYYTYEPSYGCVRAMIILYFAGNGIFFVPDAEWSNYFMLNTYIVSILSIDLGNRMEFFLKLRFTRKGYSMYQIVTILFYLLCPRDYKALAIIISAINLTNYVEFGTQLMQNVFQIQINHQNKEKFIQLSRSILLFFVLLHVRQNASSFFLMLEFLQLGFLSFGSTIDEFFQQKK